MLRMRRMRISGLLACLLIVVLQLGPVGQVMAAKTVLVPNQRIMVFPFATGNTGTQPKVGVDIGHTLTSILRSTPGYDVSDYYKRNPSLQRAALEGGTLTDKDLADPSGTDNLEIAAKIARETGNDMALIGDIESYKYDQAANTCEITITAELVDAKTGKLVKTPVVVTGLVPKTAKVSSESDCASVAAGDAVTKVVQGLDLKPSAAQQMVMPKYGTAEPERKSKKSGLLLSLLVGLGVGLAVSHSGSSGGGSGGGFEPPPPSP